jgi:hypothetical protein
MVSASDDIDSWRARLTDTELRSLAFQVSATAIAAAAEAKERDARVARIINVLASDGRVAVAFQLAERRRARELRDQFARAEALRTGCPAEGCSSTLSKAMPEPRTAGEVSGLIPNDATALVEFVGGSSGAPTTAFVLQRDRVTALNITPGDSLRERITRLTSVLESGANADALARQLGSTLLDPVFAALGPAVRNVVIIPDGALHLVTWDVLRTSHGEMACNATRSVLRHQPRPWRRCGGPRQASLPALHTPHMSSLSAIREFRVRPRSPFQRMNCPACAHRARKPAMQRATVRKASCAFDQQPVQTT